MNGIPSSRCILPVHYFHPQLGRRRSERWRGSFKTVSSKSVESLHFFPWLNLNLKHTASQHFGLFGSWGFKQPTVGVSLWFRFICWNAACGVSTSGLLGTARRKLPRSRFLLSARGNQPQAVMGCSYARSTRGMYHPNVAKHMARLLIIMDRCISPQKIKTTHGEEKKHLMTKLEYPALDFKSSKITIHPLAEHKNQLLKCYWPIQPRFSESWVCG